MAKVKKVGTGTVKTSFQKAASTLKSKKSPKRKPLTASKRTGLRKRVPTKQKYERGVVYLSNIPHGFYEEQIEGYFSQFGKVTQVSLPRSKKGKAKGFAFIEFVHPEVAEIAADTMNNYIMFNRLLKAKYIPPEEQKPKLMKKAAKLKELNKTRQDRHEENVKEKRSEKNQMLKTDGEAKVITKLMEKAKAMSQMMEELGVDYEPQVEQGNSEAVLERKKNLEERRLLDIQEARAKKKELRIRKQKLKMKKANLPSDDDDGSTASGNESVSCEITNENKSKTPSNISARPKSLSTPLVLNPTKLAHLIESSSKTKQLKPNKEVRDALKGTKPSQKPSFKPNKLKVQSLKTKKITHKTQSEVKSLLTEINSGNKNKNVKPFKQISKKSSDPTEASQKNRPSKLQQKMKSERVSQNKPKETNTEVKKPQKDQVSFTPNKQQGLKSNSSSGHVPNATQKQNSFQKKISPLKSKPSNFVNDKTKQKRSNPQQKTILKQK